MQDSHAVAVIDYSAFTFGASSYLQKQGIPVIGSAFDGPEWAEPPNSNMFTVYGLHLAGANPTSSSFIANLRKVASYNDDGLLPTPVTFQHFGTTAMLPATNCLYFEQLVGSKWVEYGGKAICGTRFQFKV